MTISTPPSSPIDPLSARIFTGMDRRNFTDIQNALAHDLAIELAEYDLDKDPKDLIEDYIKTFSPTIQQAINNSFTDEDFELFVDNVTLRAKEIQKLELKLVELNELNHDIENIRESKRLEFARVLSEVKINSGFVKKLKRGIHLGFGGGYNLKTKAQSANKNETPALVRQIAKNSAIHGGTDAEYNTKTAEIQTIRDNNSALTLVNKAEAENLEKLNKTIRRFKREFNEISDRIADFQSLKNKSKIRIPGISFFDYGNENSPVYGQAFSSQKRLEQEITAFLVGLNPLENISNVNPVEDYDPAHTTVADFKRRQSVIEVFINRLVSILENKKKDFTATKKQISENKSEAKRLVKILKPVAKAEKSWPETKKHHLEKLFWYEFGDRVLHIRELQSQLPRFGGADALAYRRHATRIFDENLQLESQISLFERHNNLEANSLLQLLQKQLGTEDFSKYMNSIEIQKAEAEIICIKKELDRRRYRRFEEAIRGRI